MFNIGDSVRHTLPDPAFGCIGIIQECFYQGSFSGEEFGYALVQIVQGNESYAIDSVTSWFLGSMELVS